MPDASGQWITEFKGNDELRRHQTLEGATAHAIKRHDENDCHIISVLWFQPVVGSDATRINDGLQNAQYHGQLYRKFGHSLSRDPIDCWGDYDPNSDHWGEEGWSSGVYRYGIIQEMFLAREAQKETERLARIPAGAVDDARDLVRAAGWVIEAKRISNPGFPYSPHDLRRPARGFDGFTDTGFLAIMDTVIRTAMHPDKKYHYTQTFYSGGYSPDFDARRFAAGVALAEGLCPAHPHWIASRWESLAPIPNPPPRAEMPDDALPGGIRPDALPYPERDRIPLATSRTDAGLIFPNAG